MSATSNRLAAGLARTIAGRVSAGTLHLTTPDGTRSTHSGAAPGPEATLVAHDPGLARRVVKQLPVAVDHYRRNAMRRAFGHRAVQQRLDCRSVKSHSCPLEVDVASAESPHSRRKHCATRGIGITSRPAPRPRGLPRHSGPAARYY